MTNCSPGEYEMKGFGVEDIVRRMIHATASRSQAELAEKLGVRRAAVTDAKRRGTIPADWFLRLGRLYNINPIWLESGLGPVSLLDQSPTPAFGERPAGYHPEEFAYVPKVTSVPRMGPEGLETNIEVEAFYAFRLEWLTQLTCGDLSELRLMTVAGDSMEPTLRDGDMVMVDQSQTDIICGKIYVVGIDDGIMVKRLDKKPGQLELISDNHTSYAPYAVDLDDSCNVRILGRVVWMAREIR